MTHLLTLKIGIAFIFLSIAGTLVASERLPIEIEMSLKQYGIKLETVSLIVKAVDEKEPRLSINPNISRNPASLVKLITSWVALNRLGPSFKWKTEFYASGDIKDGTLYGDLIVKGYGDPYLTTQDLWTILGKLKQRGLKRITGRLLLDDTYFVTDEIDPYAFDGDGTHIYNNLPNALTLNFNALDLRFSAQKDDMEVVASYFPALRNIKFSHDIRLVDGACSGKMPDIKIDAITLENHTHVKAYGKMPLSCEEYSISRNLMSRDQYFFNTFTMLWKQWGAKLDGDVGRVVLLQDHTLLYRHDSMMLADIITTMNKWSNNQMARTLIYTLGVSSDGSYATRARGIEVILAELRKHNIGEDTLLIENGSGLSRNVRASGDLISKILNIAWKDKNVSEFVSSLSIVGSDGTAAKRPQSDSSKSRMRVKTGSLDDVSAIAGYIHQDSKVFTFVCIVNSPIVNNGIGKKFENDVLSWASTLR
jgi:serine-type D-Ala-D-Ala carboxypeptidase/endopeptidase (penicillin-binding protein 4)